MTEQIRLGDVIMTRKPHPCGGSLWTVIRTGADIMDKILNSPDKLLDGEDPVSDSGSNDLPN